MDLQNLIAFMEENVWNALIAVTAISLVVFIVGRFIIARGLVYLSKQTESIYDDIIVDSLRPFRIAYFAPLLVVYSLAYLFPDFEDIIKRAVMFLAVWVAVTTVNSLLNALNTIYENRKEFSGVSIQGYLDLVKLLFVLVGVIFSISLITGESPVILLSGLGALTAVLLLVFQDTLLSLVASVRISTNDLVKIGDWIEVPSFLADGDVIDMSLHTITIQNWDKTISFVPTYKLLETPFKNWRGMSEAGGRRIKRSLSIDMRSVVFMKAEQSQRLSSLPGLDKLGNEEGLTNLGAFRLYATAMMQNDPNIHHDGLTLIVRDLDPGPKGVPVELYGFTKTTNWDEYEAIQGEIFEHLIAILPKFDLRLFQEPSGSDFAKFLPDAK